MTRKDDKGDQPSGGETTWTNIGATRYGRGQHKTGSFGDDMLRPTTGHDGCLMMMMMTDHNCINISFTWTKHTFYHTIKND